MNRKDLKERLYAVLAVFVVQSFDLATNIGSAPLNPGAGARKTRGPGITRALIDGGIWDGSAPV